MSGWSNFNNDFEGDGYDGMQGGFDEEPWDNMQGSFDGDDFHWNNMGPPPVGGPMFRNPRKARYGDAYGDYQGGYGPGGGFGPRQRPMMPPLMPPLPPPGPPPGPPPRQAMWGRGFGPGGPPRRHPDDNKAIKYLLRCGVTKDRLKNLPHDMLRLIQPDHCGLCDFSFESYTTSRMHYISKNHLKNQKKWQTKSGDVNNTELPFKARNLYCELCDIQITSKAHGEAHYEGKPHRGIVDGRKKPKNPLLLQSGMEHRLEQLIRREKRFLKPIKAKEEELEAATDPKSVPPELYCDICKTTVTCSDQMTMHMNGKRHLTKEKQHILNMMKWQGGKQKGDNDDAGEDEEEASEAPEAPEAPEALEAAEAAEAPADEATPMNVEGDDWGNEAWENQEETPNNAPEASG